MKASACFFKVMALALAILMHWAVMLVFRSEEVSHVEGAGQGAPLEIGTSFLDLQVGHRGTVPCCRDCHTFGTAQAI